MIQIPPISEASITLYNRRHQNTETEKIPGLGLLTFCYGNPLGRWICRRIVSHPVFSMLYGLPFHFRWSRRHIDDFIGQNQIDMSEVKVPAQGFSTFNDFFIRQLKPGARPVDLTPGHLIAPADSRLKVFGIDNQTILSVKGHALTLRQLLGGRQIPSMFDGGLCLQFRLAPCDYHRFGFIESGVQGRIHTVGRRLYSVNPVALRRMPLIWGDNFRHWCFIQTRHLGTLLQIEVGATVVGSIVQHNPQGGLCVRGDEKGYFQMGGSTVLVIIAPDKVIIDDDIMAYTNKGIETLVRYGEKIGSIKAVTEHASIRSDSAR